jgi:phage baseplate assembly protein W
MNKTNLYAEIVKVTKNDDGTMTVLGKATGPDLDSDKQICDPAWLAKAMPAWFQTGANIREQHTSVAAGVGTELAQDGDSWHVEALVVDPVSVKKVDAKVLKGFSIGISRPQVVKDAAAPGGRIVGGDIVEVSLVDRPANPTCMLELAKSVDGAVVEVEELHEESPLDGLVKALAAADTVKDGELPLVQQAVQAVAQLISIEAGEVADGETADTFDIAVLLDALSALRTFWFSEASEGEIPNPAPMEDDVTTVNLAQVANLVKAATADDASDEDKELLKSLADALAPSTIEDQIDAAVTKAVEASEERVTTLEARLAQVEKQATPEGPVLTRTMPDTSKAAQREQLEAEIARLDGQIPVLYSRELVEGYTQKRDALKAELAQL